jgi:hypothetical protein
VAAEFGEATIRRKGDQHVGSASKVILAIAGMLLDVDELKDAFRASSSRNEGRRATATMRTSSLAEVHHGRNTHPVSTRVARAGFPRPSAHGERPATESGLREVGSHRRRFQEEIAELGL